MKCCQTPSVCRLAGLILLTWMCTVSRTDAQPPPPPPPAPGADASTILPVPESIPIVDPSIVRDDLPARRLGISHQFFDNDFNEPFTDVRLFAPVGDDERVLFFDGRLLFGDDIGVSGVGYNFGLGARAFSEKMNAVWGINLFADRRATSLDQYHQFGFGWELLSEKWEMRSNAYLPSGSARTVTSSEQVVVGAGMPYFRENFISIDTAGELQTFEQALKGLDFEVGKRLSGASGNWLVRGYAGAYYYDNPDLGDYVGVSLRLNANYRDTVETNVTIQNDGFFGAQAGLGVSLYMDGLFRHNDTFHSRTLDARNHLARPVERKQLITVVRGSAILGSPGTLDLIDPMTGDPITVTHIDSNGAGADLGTVDDPFLSLTSAAGSSTDIAYVYSGSTFNAEEYALADEQRFLGEGGFAYAVDTAELGTIVLPDGNGGAITPVLMNSPADAITLASDSEVTNFDIMLPVGSGIAGTSVSNSIVNAVLVTDSLGPAVSLNDSSVIILDSIFSTSGAGAHGIEATAAGTIDILNTPISTGGVGAFGITTADSVIVNLYEGSTIDTTGDMSHGVFTSDSSEVNLTEASHITTTGNDAYGVRSTGTSSVVLDATDLMTSGMTAHGVMAEDDSSVSILSGSTVTTNAADAIGLYAISSSDLILSGSTVSTVFNGVDLENSSSLVASNGSLIETSGNGGIGILANDDTSVLLNGSSIDTTGTGSLGVLTFDLSTVTLDGSQITTSGDSGYGVYSLGISEVEILNGTLISTGGMFGYGVVADGNSLVTINGSDIETMGDNSEGLFLFSSSSVSVTGGSTISTAGSSSDGANIRSNSTLEILDSLISTTAANALGITLSDASSLRLVDSSVDSAMDDEIRVTPGVGLDIEAEIHGNSLQNGAGSVTLNNIVGSSLTIVGPAFASLADFAAANGILPGQVTETGVITYAPSP